MNNPQTLNLIPIPANQPVQQLGQQPVMQPTTPAMPAPATGQAQAPTMPMPAQAPAAMPQVNLMQATGQTAVPNAMDAMLKAMTEAKVSDQRRNLPVGQAIYAINNVVFTVTEQSSRHIDKMILTCVTPMNDANGLKYGTQGYSGAIPGMSYEYPIFRDYKMNYHVREWLNVVKCMLGITGEQLSQIQASPGGDKQLLQYVSYYFGFDFSTNQPTQSCLANTEAVEINVTVNRKAKKVNGQSVYDASGQPIMVDYHNTFFNRRVLLSELLAAFAGREAELYKCFGGQENFERAYAVQNSQ